MAKSRCEQVADFVDRWSSDLAGRYEVRLTDGRTMILHDCYLSHNMGNQLDIVWVNQDTAGQPKDDFDILDVAATVDSEQGFFVIE
jgi:hypothetical protein